MNLQSIARASTSARAMAAGLVLSAGGTAFVVTNEGGSHQRVYLDSVGLPTVCVGHMDRSLTVGDIYSQSDCDRFFLQDTSASVRAVKRLVKVPLHQSEFDTLVDFVFQFGEGAFARSTLLVYVNQGRYDLAAKEFPKWRFAGGKDCKVRKSNCYGVYDRALRRAALFTSEHQ